MPKRENAFQAELIREIKKRMPESMVLKNDSSYIQGFPDITVLFEGGWAVLEAKREKDASHRPNQDYYVTKMGTMGFSKFVYPENREDVLNELERAYQLGRSARIS